MGDEDNPKEDFVVEFASVIDFGEFSLPPVDALSLTTVRPAADQSLDSAPVATPLRTSSLRCRRDFAAPTEACPSPPTSTGHTESRVNDYAPGSGFVLSESEKGWFRRYIADPIDHLALFGRWKGTQQADRPATPHRGRRLRRIARR